MDPQVSVIPRAGFCTQVSGRIEIIITSNKRLLLDLPRQ